MGERGAISLDEAKMILAEEGLYRVGKQVLGRWKPREISATPGAIFRVCESPVSTLRKGVVP